MGHVNLVNLVKLQWYRIILTHWPLWSDFHNGYVTLLSCDTTKIWQYFNFNLFQANKAQYQSAASAMHRHVNYYRLDISRCNTTRYYTQQNNFEDKTSFPLRTHERHPYLALTGELWVSFVSYLDKSDHEISEAHCGDGNDAIKDISKFSWSSCRRMCIFINFVI